MNPVTFNSLGEVIEYFHDQSTCLKFIEHFRWRGNISCPHCSHDQIYRFKDDKRFKCKKCFQLFTATTKTIFHNTKTPLKKWMIALYLIMNNKKGISSYQLAKYLAVTQKSAWLIAHKIRAMLFPSTEKLAGVIAVDETFYGGKNANRHKDKKMKYRKTKEREYQDKVPIMGFLELGGNVRYIVLPDVKTHNLLPKIKDNVDTASSIVVTDEYGGYDDLHEFAEHQKVHHDKGRWMNDCGFSTNAIEGRWKELKLTLKATHNHVPRKHLQRYVNEIAFRANHRFFKPGETFLFGLSNINTTLTYNQLVYEKDEKGTIQKKQRKQRKDSWINQIRSRYNDDNQPGNASEGKE